MATNEQADREEARYRDCEGKDDRLIIYDTENPDAWVQSDYYMSVGPSE